LGGGSLEWTIKFERTQPPPVKIDLGEYKNASFCIEHTPANEKNQLLLKRVEIADGNLKDAVIYFEDIREGKPRNEEKIEFDFNNYLSFPKVAVIRIPLKKIKKRFNLSIMR
jgi:hypothetical protein